MASTNAIKERAQEVKFDVDDFLKTKYALVEKNMTTVMSRLANTFKLTKLSLWQSGSARGGMITLLNLQKKSTPMLVSVGHTG